MKKLENNEIDADIKKLNRKTIIFTVISIVLLLCVIIASTYSMFVKRIISSEYTYNTGNLSVEFSEEAGSVINLSNQLPTSDDIGSKSDSIYKFSITGNTIDELGNTLSSDYVSKYTIRLVPQTNSQISADKIKVKINDNDPVLLSRTYDNIIDCDIVEINETKDFNIRLWIDINADYQNVENSTFEAKIVVTSKAIRYELPVEYQKVEYIESTGSQYIDTGVIPNNKTKIEVDANLINLGTDYNYLFGSRNDENDTSSWFELLKESNAETIQNAWRYHYGKTTNMKHIVRDTERHKFILDAIALTGKIDDTIINTFEENEQNSSTNTIALFASNYGSYYAYPISSRIYSTKIWNNGDLVRDYIPVVRVSDNLAGLYDLINNEFYSDLGNNIFNYGSNVD